MIFFGCLTRTVSGLEMDGTGHCHEVDPLSLFSAQSPGGSEISSSDAPRETAIPLFLHVVPLTRGSSVPVCGLRELFWLGSGYELELQSRALWFKSPVSVVLSKCLELSELQFTHLSEMISY